MSSMLSPFQADEHQSTATDSAGLSGWDKVNKLAETLLYVKPCVTDSQVVEIKRLYLSLEEYDRKPLTFSPRMKKATGRFKQTKGNRSGHIGVEAMARYGVLSTDFLFSFGSGFPRWESLRSIRRIDFFLFFSLFPFLPFFFFQFPPIFSCFWIFLCFKNSYFILSIYLFLSLFFIRCFVTAGQPVSPPSRSRVVEAICIRLCDESADQRSQGPGKPYLSKWKVVLQKYNQIRRAVYNSPLHDEISLQLFAINESTLADW